MLRCCLIRIVLPRDGNYTQCSSFKIGLMADIWQVDALYECCNAFYQEKGETASTVSCPKYTLLKYDVPLLVLELCSQT